MNRSRSSRERAGEVLARALSFTPLREHLAPDELPGTCRFVRVGNYTIHYTDEGPRDGPVLLLLHGFAAWAFTWRRQRQALAAAGFRVIAIDQLGYGASPRPAAPIYTTYTQARLTLGVLDALGIEQAHVGGHSFGGRVALQVAIMAAERVRSLLLLCPEAFARARPPVARLVRAPLIGYALSLVSIAPPLVPTGLRMVSKRTSWITSDVAAGYAAPLYVRGTASAQVWQARSPKDGAPPVPDQLGSIKHPALILWGAGDSVFPVSDGHKLAERMPGATLRVFDGVGHLPHEEAPGETGAAMMSFLEHLAH